MWSRDIQDGEAAERLVADYLLRTTHKVVHKAMGNFPDYDLIGDGVTYEVKNDRRAKQTGNIAIEYEYKGEHSGIRKTKAQMWVHLISDTECLMFPTHKLRGWLNLQQQYLKRVESVEHAKSLLVPIEEIVGRDFCDVIDLYANTTSLSRVATAPDTTGNVPGGLHLNGIRPHVSEGGTVGGEGEAPAALPQVENSDDTADTRIDEIAGRILKNVLSG